MEEKLLTLINQDWTSPALDGWMAVMSSINFWAVPLIVLVVAVAVYGRFRARAMLVVLALTLVISDSLIGNGLKHLIRRPRPNEVAADVRIVSLDLHRPIPRLLALFGAEKAGGSGWIRVTSSRPDPDHAEGRSFPSDHTLNNSARRWSWHASTGALAGFISSRRCWWPTRAFMWGPIGRATWRSRLSWRWGCRCCCWRFTNCSGASSGRACCRGSSSGTRACGSPAT